MASPPTVNCDIKNKKYCDVGHYCKLTDTTAQTGTCEPCECDIPGYTNNPCRPYYSGPNKLEQHPFGCNLNAVEGDFPDVNKVCDGKGTSNPYAGVKCNAKGLCPSGLKCNESEMCPPMLCQPECQDFDQIVNRDPQDEYSFKGYWWDTSIKDTCLKNGWSPDGKNCDGTCSPCTCQYEWQQPDTGIYDQQWEFIVQTMCNGSETSKPGCVNICPIGSMFDQRHQNCQPCEPADAKILNNKNEQTGSQKMQLRNYAVEPGTTSVLNQNDIKRKFCGGWQIKASKKFWKQFSPQSPYPIWAVTGCPEGYYLEKTHPNSKENDYSCKECACDPSTSTPPNYKGNCPMRDEVCFPKIFYPKYIACGKPSGDPLSEWGPGCQEINRNDKVNSSGPEGVNCSMTLSGLGTPVESSYASYDCTPYKTISCTNGVCRGDTPCHNKDWWCCYNLCEKKVILL